MIRVKTFYSKYLHDKRKIYVFLPPGYNAFPERTYPVLYMQDGQNIFSRQGTGPLRWNVDLTALNLIRRGVMEEIIIVGISNSEWRDDEYTPTEDEEEGSGGYADLYLKYLIFEVKHYIDVTFRVRPFREDTGIAGSSLGGLLSLYAAMTYPEIFGKIAVISPSLWWDEWAIMDMIKSWEIDPQLMKLWLDMGYNETDPEELEPGEPDEIDEVRFLRKLLKERGFRIGRSFRYFEDFKGFHDEISWGRRMRRVLTFLFGRRG